MTIRHLNCFSFTGHVCFFMKLFCSVMSLLLCVLIFFMKLCTMLKVITLWLDLQNQAYPALYFIIMLVAQYTCNSGQRKPYKSGLFLQRLWLVLLKFGKKIARMVCRYIIFRAVLLKTLKCSMCRVFSQQVTCMHRCDFSSLFSCSLLWFGWVCLFRWESVY